MPRPAPSPLAAEGARLAAAAAAALARAVDDCALCPELASACKAFEQHAYLVASNAEAADALLAASPPLLRAIARAARFVAAESARRSAHVGVISFAASATYSTIAWLCDSQRQNRGAGFAPQAATTAALCAPAAPLLDACAAYLSRRPSAPGMGDPDDPALLRVAGALLRSPFPGGERALARVLTAERLMRAVEPALAAARAPHERAPGRALSAADVPLAFADARDAQSLLQAMLWRDLGAERSRHAAAAAAAAATRAAAALITLLYARAAAAAEARSPEVGADELFELAKVLASGLLLLVDAAGPSLPAWAPWVHARAALASAALIRFFGARPGAGADADELALCVLMAQSSVALAMPLLEAGQSAGVAAALGAVAAALGAALARALGEPRLEALTRRAGAALAGAPVGLARVGAMEELPPERPVDASCIAIALLALAQRLPAAALLAPDADGAATELADAIARLLLAWRGADPGVGNRRPHDCAAMLQLVAHTEPSAGRFASLMAASSWLPKANDEEGGERDDSEEPPADSLPAPEWHAAVLAGAAAARELLDAAAAAGAATAHPTSPTDRGLVASAPVSGALLFMAASAPGAAGALWAAPGGLGALRDAARALWATAAAPPAERTPVGACVDAAAAILLGMFGAHNRSGALARLPAASGAARELALYAAARYRESAPGCDGGADCRCFPCTSGLGKKLLLGRRTIGLLLQTCWAAAAGTEPPTLAAPLFALHRAAVEPAEAYRTAVDAYEALAADFGARGAQLCADFERDAAPALRVAAARAAAALFCCSNVRCARTAGLRRAEDRALAPAKRCSRCMVARYCSAECQAADWRAGHKAVCRALAAGEGAAGGA